MKPVPLLALLGFLAVPASATVTMEFHIGGVQVPAGSVGVLVADTNLDGFSSPFTAGGSPLAAGQKIGPDDTIVSVFTPSTLADFTSGEGFAGVFAGIDYAALGIAEDQPLRFYVFPERNPGDPIRSGEPHVSYTTTDLTPNSTMDFSLPRDGGSYLLAALGTEVGGTADLASVDIAPFDHGTVGSPLNRSLGESSVHTYFFEVTSAGVLRIEGGGAAGLRAELIGPDGEPIATADGAGDFAFEEDLGLGFHTLVVFRDQGGPTELPYSLQVTDETGGVVLIDVSVGPRPAAPIGNNVYGGTPGQLATLLSRRARPVTGHARVGNDGNLAEAIGVRVTPGNRLCRITYLGSAGNVTGDLLSGTFRTPELESTDLPVALRVQFAPNRKKLTRKRNRRSATLRRTFTSRILATPATAATAGDAASIRVRTR